MSKPSKVAMRAVERLFNDVHLEAERWHQYKARIIDQEFAPAIEALKMFANGYSWEDVCDAQIWDEDCAVENYGEKARDARKLAIKVIKDMGIEWVDEYAEMDKRLRKQLGVPLEEDDNV